VAKGSLPPSVVTSLGELNGRVAAGPINAKQFITEGTWVSATDGIGGVFSTAIGAPDLVAVTISVDADHGVANQIAPGDHVNIATTTTDAAGNAQTTYFMTKVKVLAVGASTIQQSLATAAAGAPPPQASGVLTFEVSQADALRVIAANSGGSRLYLVLLPPDVSSPATSGGTKAAASSK
jgi:Flp pilus assembly protein CpaB